MVMKSSADYFFTLIIFSSCQSQNKSRVDLSGDYWFKIKGGLRMIESKKLVYYNTIYPDVVNYAYNDSFIIAEQVPRADEYIGTFSEDLLGRFENYRHYTKDTSILSQEFYSRYRGYIEKDSTLYKSFVYAGAGESQSKNRVISINLTESLIKTDPYFIDLFGREYVYWIIVHKTGDLLGPFSKEIFFKKGTELNIPSELLQKIEK